MFNYLYETLSDLPLKCFFFFLLQRIQWYNFTFYFGNAIRTVRTNFFFRTVLNKFIYVHIVFFLLSLKNWLNQKLPSYYRYPEYWAQSFILLLICYHNMKIVYFVTFFNFFSIKNNSYRLKLTDPLKSSIRIVIILTGLSNLYKIIN